MRDYKIKTIDALHRGLLVLENLHDMHPKYAERAVDFGGDDNQTRDQSDDGCNSIAMPICAGGQVLGCVNLTWRMSVLTADHVVERHLGARPSPGSEEKVTVARGTDLKIRTLNGNGTTPVALAEPTLATS